MPIRRTIVPGAARRRTVRRRLTAGVVGLLAVMSVPAAARAEVRPATPATFGSVLASAQPGDVVELAPGAYGRFNGATKDGMVTIRSAAPGAATMSVRFNGARNLRLESLTIPELDISGSSSNIVVAGSVFTGGAVVRADQMVNANVVFDGNVHPNINVCGNCYEGRLQVVGRGSGPSGVTVQNSRFGPGGDADGMQIGSDGVQVLNNEFVGIRQVSQVHTDSLQLYGARNTVIRGNYFHDFNVAIMAPDGGLNEQITDNVFVGDGSYVPAIQLGSHRGSQFVHNTVKNINVHMDRKSENPGNPSRDGVIRDNVFVNGSIGGYTTDPSYCSNCTLNNNLFSSAGRAEGTNALVGMALFAGGANPSSWHGHALAAGSPGKGRATDGGDMGIRLSARAASQPPPAPAAPAPPSSPSRPGARRRAARLKLDSHITFRVLRRGIKIRVTARRAMRLKLRLSRKGARRAIAVNTVRMKRGTKTFRLRPSGRRLGRPRAQTLVLRVKAKPRKGRAFVLRRVIHVRLAR